MSYEEFGRISRELKVGDCPGQMFWDDIELVYMSTGFSKETMARLYWKDTGLFESIVAHIKAHIELRKKAKSLRYPFELDESYLRNFVR